MTIDPEESFYTSSAYAKCQEYVKPLFKSEQNLRDYLKEDRKSNNYFNSKAVTRNGIVQVHLTGKDLEAGIQKLFAILGIDTFDGTTHRDYGPKQEIINDGLFEMDEYCQLGLPIYIVRGYYKNNPDRVITCCFKKEYVDTVRSEVREGKFNGKPVRFLKLHKAVLKI